MGSSRSNEISTTATDQKPHRSELKLKTLLQKMVWELGFSRLLPPCRRDDKAWLLAESGGCGGPQLTSAEPQSVHSSFRFSLCSQIEVESTTVLMVNLDNGFADSSAGDVRWRRIESLERSISPVCRSLVRFSFGEILSATHGFSKES